MKKTTITLGALSIFFIILITGFSTYIGEGLQQVRQQEREALQLLASSSAPLQEISEVSFFAGEGSFYSVIQGKDPAGEKKWVWLNEEETLEYDARGKMQREEAVQATRSVVKDGKILRLTPGLFEKRPVWEAFVRDDDHRYWYLYFQMEDSRLIRQYQLQ